MTLPELRAFGALPFSLKIRPKRFQQSWPNFILRDAHGKSICAGACRTNSIHALTQIVFDSHAAARGISPQVKR